MRALYVVSIATLVLGCDQSDFDLPPLGDDPPPGPGSPTWNDEDLTCSSDADCAGGETCGTDQTCRPRQCDDGPYNSVVPLGPRHVFFPEQELLVADATASNGTYWIDGYDAASTVAYDGGGGGSFSIGASITTDVARIHTETGSGIVVASQGSSKVTVIGRAVPRRTVDVGLVPVAIATGDIDGDLADDILALSATGHVAVCKLAGGCTQYTFGGGGTGIDIAAGDVNGDGADEVLFAMRESDGGTTVAAWTVGVDDSVVAATFDAKFDAVTAGDVDHDGRAEVAMLEDGGWLGYGSDRIHLYRVGSAFTGVSVTTTSSSAIDLAAGNVTGADSGDTVAILGSNKSVDLMRWTGNTLASAGTGTVTATAAPKRIALGDLDDDSVAARLVAGPELVAGNLLPTVVVNFPPYDGTVSNGGVSAVSIGNRTDTSTEETGTVALQAGIEVGVDADFLGVFKARLSTKLSTEIRQSKTLGRKWSVGTKFSLRAQPELYGPDYSAVVVAGSCFHTYTYELVDPANRMGGSGHKMTVVVPVGGETTVLSTSRYRALAARIPSLPAIQSTRRLGDPSTYPRTPTRLDGTAVQPDDMVFPEVPLLRASDVGTVAFSLAASTYEINTTAMTTSVSASGQVTAAGIMVGASLGASWGSSYSINVGRTAEFGGETPPIADDPSTQEDEYAQHAFSYSPYVYRQSYEDATGATTGYYVLDYAVSAR